MASCGHTSIPRRFHRRLRPRLLVPSSLYGISSGEDRIADFRLKMNIGVESLGTTAAFWRPKSTDASSFVARENRPTRQSLCRRSTKWRLTSTPLANPEKWCESSSVDDGGSPTVGHDAKAVKGVLARALLEDGLGRPASFEWSGWRAQNPAMASRISSPAPDVDGWSRRNKRS